MNSSIVKLQETNEKMKEEGENKFNQIVRGYGKEDTGHGQNMGAVAKITSRNM